MSKIWTTTVLVEGKEVRLFVRGDRTPSNSDNLVFTGEDGKEQVIQTGIVAWVSSDDAGVDPPGYIEAKRS